MLAEIKDRFGFRMASEDYRDVLAAGVDICVVSSPAGLHYRHAKDAMEAGAHVLVEKPFTLNVDDAWDLVETAERLGRHLVVAYGFNYLTAVIAFGELLREAGGIGSLEQCVLSMASCTRELLATGGSYPEVGHSGIPAPDPETWTNAVLSGGGYAQAQLTHLLGLALPLLGTVPVEVIAATGSLPGVAIDMYDAAVLRFRGGAVGTLAGGSSWVGADSSRDVVTLRAIGSEGQWLLDLDAERAWVFRQGWSEERRLVMPPGSGNYDCAGPPNALVDLVLGKQKCNRSSGTLAARTVAVLDAFYRSVGAGGEAAAVMPR